MKSNFMSDVHAISGNKQT